MIALVHLVKMVLFVSILTTVFSVSVHQIGRFVITSVVLGMIFTKECVFLQGPTCDIDVDECTGFRGTELGCQNGATCVNTAGSYRCTCPTGWFGVHCTQKTDGCNSGTNEQICGHGICLSQPGQGRGYICLCEQVRQLFSLLPSN